MTSRRPRGKNKEQRMRLPCTRCRPKKRPTRTRAAMNGFATRTNPPPVNPATSKAFTTTILLRNVKKKLLKGRHWNIYLDDGVHFKLVCCVAHAHVGPVLDVEHRLALSDEGGSVNLLHTHIYRVFRGRRFQEHKTDKSWLELGGRPHSKVTAVLFSCHHICQICSTCVLYCLQNMRHFTILSGECSKGICSVCPFCRKPSTW